MSWFSADERMEAVTTTTSPATVKPAPPRTQPQPAALFAADEQLEQAAPVASGPPSAKPPAAGTPPANCTPTPPANCTPTPPACPACERELASEDGWLRCPTCRPRYLIVAGRLLAENALPHGACACCRPRRPLVTAGDGVPAGENAGLVCPLSGRRHVWLEDGRIVLQDKLPPAPQLAPQAQGPGAGLPELAEIDAALARNSGLLATHGVFVRTPKRR